MSKALIYSIVGLSGAVLAEECSNGVRAAFDADISDAAGLSSLEGSFLYEMTGPAWNGADNTQPSFTKHAWKYNLALAGDHSDGITFHLHRGWEMDGQKSCGASSTGGHFDPAPKCGAATGDPNCTTEQKDAYACATNNVQECEIGDLTGQSGKVFGTYNAETGETTFTGEFETAMEGLDPTYFAKMVGNIDAAGGAAFESVVIHSGGARVACAPLDLVADSFVRYAADVGDVGDFELSVKMLEDMPCLKVVEVDATLDGLSDAGPMTYHLHEKWGDGTCGAPETGLHYDPTFECGPASAAKDLSECADKTYTCGFGYGEQDTCEMGDLSGRGGSLPVVDNSVSVHQYHLEYATNIKISTADFDPEGTTGGYDKFASVVFHGNGGARVACGQLTAPSSCGLTDDDLDELLPILSDCELDEKACIQEKNVCDSGALFAKFSSCKNTLAEEMYRVNDGDRTCQSTLSEASLDTDACTMTLQELYLSSCSEIEEEEEEDTSGASKMVASLACGLVGLVAAMR